MTEPCVDRQDAIQELLDGELPAPARAELEAHLDGCAGCRAYHAAMGRLFGRLDAGLKAPGPVPELRVPPPAVAPFRPRRLVAWGAAAAAVLLVVGLELPRVHAPTELAASPAAVAEQQPQLEDGQAILTWFGPEADSDGSELPL